MIKKWIKGRGVREVMTGQNKGKDNKWKMISKGSNEKCKQWGIEVAVKCGKLRDMRSKNSS